METVHVTDEVLETVWRFEERGRCTVEDVKKEHEDAYDTGISYNPFRF